MRTINNIVEEYNKAVESGLECYIKKVKKTNALIIRYDDSWGLCLYGDNNVVIKCEELIRNGNKKYLYVDEWKEYGLDEIIRVG